MIVGFCAELTTLLRFWIGPDVSVKYLALLFRIKEILGSVLDPATEYPDVVCVLFLGDGTV
jgi:hypothetical protein